MQSPHSLRCRACLLCGSEASLRACLQACPLSPPPPPLLCWSVVLARPSRLLSPGHRPPLPPLPSLLCWPWWSAGLSRGRCGDRLPCWWWPCRSSRPPRTSCSLRCPPPLLLGGLLRLSLPFLHLPASGRCTSLSPALPCSPLSRSSLAPAPLLLAVPVLRSAAQAARPLPLPEGPGCL